MVCNLLESRPICNVTQKSYQTTNSHTMQCNNCTFAVILPCIKTAYTVMLLSHVLNVIIKGLTLLRAAPCLSHCFSCHSKLCSVVFSTTIWQHPEIFSQPTGRDLNQQFTWRSNWKRAHLTNSPQSNGKTLQLWRVQYRSELNQEVGVWKTDFLKIVLTNPGFSSLPEWLSDLRN